MIPITTAGLVSVGALLLRPTPVYAQTTNATCRADYDWMLNAKGQTPCLVAAYAESACSPDLVWNVTPPPNSTVTYAGPDGTLANPCTCSSVVFCLLSACAFCQGDGLPNWEDWIAGCPADDVSNGQFPAQTPEETVIPPWAYQQVVHRFNVTVAESVAAASRPTPVSSAASSATSGAQRPPSDSGSKKSSDLGPIIGGVVGGVVILALLLGLGFYFLRSKRRNEVNETQSLSSLAEPKPERPDKAEVMSLMSTPFTPPPPEHMNTTFPSPGLMKLYDPNDPSTYPTPNIASLLPYRTSSHDDISGPQSFCTNRDGYTHGSSSHLPQV